MIHTIDKLHLAPDRESYKLFSSLFDPIIKDYHSFEKDDSQPDIDFGEDRIPELTDLDPEGKYIESTRWSIFRLILLVCNA